MLDTMFNDGLAANNRLNINNRLNTGNTELSAGHRYKDMFQQDRVHR